MHLVYVYSLISQFRGCVCPLQGIPAIMKVLVTQRFPAWMRPAYLGVVGAAVAWLALFVTKHVSVSIQLH